MNVSTGRPPKNTANRSGSRRYLRFEALALILSAPLLLAPDVYPVATGLALLTLGILWLFSVYVVPPGPTPFDAALCLWGCALIVGVLVTADPLETLPKATGLILGLGGWRLTVLLARTRRAIFIAVALLLLLSLGFSLIGIFGLRAFPKIPALAQINPFQPGALPGLEGLVVHPNQLAGLICLFLPLLVSLLFAAPPEFSSRPRRLAILLATLWATWILLLTQSRGGWIGAVAGLVVLLTLWATILPRSRQRLWLWVLLGLVAVGGIVAVIGVGPGTLRELWLDPPQETVVGTLTTLNFRKELWPWALTAIGDFPFTGVGLGAFRQVAFRLYPLALSPEYDIAHAHNIFLQTALDVGLPGLIVYLAILLIAAVSGWRVARHHVGYRPVSLGLLAGLAALHIYGLADALALGSKPAVVLWLALGLLAAMNNDTPLGD